MNKPRKLDVIRNVTVVDPDTGSCAENQDIHIHAGAIRNVCKTQSGSDSQDLDGSGLFAIPGLIDAHVHALGIFHHGDPDLFDMAWIKRQQEKNLTAFLMSGVTTVRDLGAPLNMIRGFARRSKSWDILAPRILFSGPVLTVAGGYPSFVTKPPLLVEMVTGAVRVDLKSPAHARRIVTGLARAGVHCIKICYQSVHYDNARSPLELMPVPLIQAVADCAHEHNLPVAVHCAYSHDLPGLLEAPFDTWEHPCIDAALDNETVKRVADKGVPVITTMMAFGVIDHMDQLNQYRLDHKHAFEPKPRRYLRNACKALAEGDFSESIFGENAIKTGSMHMRENVAKLHDAGVRICFGTDSGGAIIPCGRPQWEFMDMKRAGLSDHQALRSATTVAAETLCRPDLGRIGTGATADLVLLEGNPVEDIMNTSRIAAVIRDGCLAFPL